MKKECLIKTIAIVIVVFFISSGIVSAFNANNESKPLSNGSWLYVGGSGEGNYSRIQDAIDNASDGDTVFVFNGFYNENPRIHKSISLIGEDKYLTIIDGGGRVGDTVELFTDYITIHGFTIKNSGDWANDAGIGIQSAWGVHSWYNCITGNVISYNGHYGIDLYESSHNIISDNIIQDNQDNGINFISYCNNNEISGNTIINDSIRFGGAPSNNLISHNTIKNGDIKIDFGPSNIINYNMIENGGIRLYETSGIIIKDNTFNSSGGITITTSPQITIYNNHLTKSVGIIIIGGGLEDWNTHIIENNDIDGKSIYYYKDNQNGGIIENNASQVILANCKNFVIQNNNIDHGIQLSFSSCNNLTKNIIKNNTGDGIILYKSSNNFIEYNTIMNNNVGVRLSEGNENTIFGNTILKNAEEGIRIDSGLLNKITRNNIEENKYGVSLYACSGNKIYMNNFVHNTFINAFFVAEKLLQRINLWNLNYWSNGIFFLPRYIFGLVKTPLYFEQWYTYEKIYIYRPGFDYDWHPAKEPYDI